MKPLKIWDLSAIGRDIGIENHREQLIAELSNGRSIGETLSHLREAARLFQHKRTNASSGPEGGPLVEAKFPGNELFSTLLLGVNNWLLNCLELDDNLLLEQFLANLTNVNLIQDPGQPDYSILNFRYLIYLSNDFDLLSHDFELSQRLGDDVSDAQNQLAIFGVRSRTLRDTLANIIQQNVIEKIPSLVKAHLPSDISNIVLGYIERDSALLEFELANSAVIQSLFQDHLEEEISVNFLLSNMDDALVVALIEIGFLDPPYNHQPLEAAEAQEEEKE